ncbi:hypothetical protein BDZ89DRAFT_1062657 [Hymenopellis radicata]|nr:hypothetical protein BDZ89DRAFT_1062657 [Hymenopellis radicata]
MTDLPLVGIQWPNSGVIRASLVGNLWLSSADQPAGPSAWTRSSILYFSYCVPISSPDVAPHLRLNVILLAPSP